MNLVGNLISIEMNIFAVYGVIFKLNVFLLTRIGYILLIVASNSLLIAVQQERGPRIKERIRQTKKLKIEKNALKINHIENNKTIKNPYWTKFSTEIIVIFYLK